MAKWLTDEKVLEFSEGRDNSFPLERVIETYQSIVRGEGTEVYSKRVKCELIS